MKNILIVDDEADILETIIETLEVEFGSNVKIHKAMNGHEALNLFGTGNSFDLLVTDLNMPEMSGVELTDRVLKIKHDCPIIVFTGHGDFEEQEKLNELGVRAMIKKPYVEDLIDEVSSILLL